MDASFAMREFIMATERLNQLDEATGMEPEEEVSEVSEAACVHGPALVEDLQEIIFKLRAFMESSGGEYGYGVELGMQRAADMIENAIKRHGG